MDFWEKIRRLVGERPLAGVARRAGLDPTALSAILNNRYMPRLDRAQKIAFALGVSLDWLGDDEQGWPPPESRVFERAQRLLDAESQSGLRALTTIERTPVVMAAALDLLMRALYSRLNLDAVAGAKDLDDAVDVAEWVMRDEAVSAISTLRDKFLAQIENAVEGRPLENPQVPERSAAVLRAEGQQQQRRRRKRRSVRREPKAEHAARHETPAMDITDLLTHLPEDHFQKVTRLVLEGLEPDHIAKALGVPPRQVHADPDQARARLQKLVSPAREAAKGHEPGRS